MLVREMVKASSSECLLQSCGYSPLMRL
uniref:Uncharacterized protein n=1 Tax=Anguilla anguilla TaxID=7936 RepID=A0A0E9WBU1_ANGAN